MCGMDNLPPELVTMTLNYLGHADLRAAAAVSRTFHASAFHIGLCVHRKVSMCEQPARLCATLERTVRDVVEKGFRLSLSVFVHSGNGSRKERASSSPSAPHELISLMVSALPVLVSLSISLPDSFVPTLAAALRVPAPHLAALDLEVFNLTYTASERLSADLFARAAPSLRSVRLSGIALPRDTVAAFSHVDSVEVEYDCELPDIDYPRHFPHLLDLQLHGAEPPHTLKLAGLSLRKLSVENGHIDSFMPAIRAAIDLSQIANVEQITDGEDKVDWADPLWNRTDDGPVSMRVTERPDTYLDFALGVVVVPAHRRWRRAFVVCHNVDRRMLLPGLDMPGRGERLAYLRMDVQYIVSLLMCRGVALRALRRLQVDIPTPEDSDDDVVLWPPALRRPPPGPRVSRRNRVLGEGWYYLRCPALETLTLFALEDELVVKSEEVVFLARALYQCRVRKKDRAALALVGIKPSSVAAVKLTFSAVRRYAFVGGDSPAGQDEGLWDDGD